MIPRLERLRLGLAEKGLEAILVTQAENRRYLSGFTGSAGALIITAHRALLATDFRYVEQARSQAPEFEVVHIKGELAHWLPGLATTEGIRRLGFESSDLSHATYSLLAETAGRSAELVPTQGMVEALRAIKEPEEIDRIARASALVDSAVRYLRRVLRPGMTEREAAWRLERFLREKGSEAMPFDLIVASGPNAALPHAHPTERAIQPGEPIVIDIGARVEGYISDHTRTLCLGSPDATFHKVYGIVLQAQRRALEGIKIGMTGHQADALARGVIQEAGYGDAFGHGLGHGVGLATHEEPRLGPESTATLAAGMVVTVEPGIYLPGWGGVRLEDLVVLEESGPRLLSSLKDLGRAVLE